MKTHYERIIVSELVQSQLTNIRRSLGEHATYRDIALSSVFDEANEMMKKYLIHVYQNELEAMSNQTEMHDFLQQHLEQQMIFTTNMMFHVYKFVTNHMKIYQISQDLGDMLMNTTLKKVPSELLQSPYEEIVLETPINLLSLNDGETGEHNVYNIYVNIEEHTGEKVLKLFIAALSNENSVDELDDKCFYFKLIVKDGENIHDSVNRQADDFIADGKKYSDSSDLMNIKKISRIFNFVLNCLLYITGAECDIKYIDRRRDLQGKMDRAKSGGKRKKWERMINNCDLPKYVIGSSIKLTRMEKEAYDCARTGTGSKHTSRTIVQGHWRNQVYGEGRSLRKMVWIKPFWRGPEFGELINKKHRVSL